jgi:hypothetical protein
MMYNLTRCLLYYGAGPIPFVNADECESLPATINGADDLDLEAIARDLNRYVYDRGRARSTRKAATMWGLEFTGTTPEKAAELNAALAKDEALAHLDLPTFKPTIIVQGKGVSLIYEAAA